jgi:hypothetical protein
MRHPIFLCIVIFTRKATISRAKAGTPASEIIISFDSSIYSRCYICTIWINIKFSQHFTVYRFTSLLIEIPGIDGPHKMCQLNLMLLYTCKLQLHEDSVVMKVVLSVQ